MPSPSAFGVRVWIKIFIPSALATLITSIPMWPAPTTPNVLPFTSVWLTCKYFVKLLRSPLASIPICCCIVDAKLRIIMITVCATRSVLYAGMLHTVIPRSFAALRSILL